MAPSSTDLRIQAASDFLRFLVSGADGQAYLALTVFQTADSGEKRVHPYFFRITEFEAAAKLAIAQAGVAGQNVYFQPTLLKTPPTTGRGTKEHVAGSTVLWVDIDAKQHRSVEQIIADLKAFEKPPSWVNLSGNGVHAYWKLDTFVEDTQQIESRNRQLMDHLSADNCWDMVHIFRVPGTYNYKKQPAKPVTAIDTLCTRKIYSLSDFSQAPITEGAGRLEDILEEALPETFLDKLPQDIRLRIEIGPVDRTDRSTNDWFIARKLLELGFAAGQILTVLTHPIWFSGEKARQNGYTYPVHTIARALQEHTTKYSETTVLLQPVIDTVLIATEKGGIRKKIPLIQGSDFVSPAVRHLETAGYKFYNDRISQMPYIGSPKGDIVQASNFLPDYERWIYGISGFTAEEREHRVLRSGLAAHAREHGVTVRMTPWCYHDMTARTVYILADMAGRDVIRIKEGQEPTIVPNGVDNLVMQKSSLVSQPIKFQPDAEWADASKVLIEETHDRFAMPVPVRSLLTCYMLAIPLVYGFNISTLPLLHLTGAAGRGKSQTLGLISTFLHGRPELLNNVTLAAAYRMAEKEILMPFDDYERLDDQHKQFILTSVTGAQRQKSGAGATDTIKQQTHIMLALTSIAPLDDAATRRRAIVNHIDKVAWGKNTQYSEGQWLRISERRSYLWSAYARWLGKELLPMLNGYNVSKKQKVVQDLIKEEDFKPLSGFLALMSTISEAMKPYAPGKFSGDDNEMIDWINWLSIGSGDELAGRNMFLEYLEGTFDILQAAASSIGHTRVNTSVKYDEDEYSNITKVIKTVLVDRDWQLSLTDPKKLPQGDVPGSVWIGLEGTALGWVTTLRNITKGRSKVQPSGFGHAIFSMLGHRIEIEEGYKTSKKYIFQGRWAFTRLAKCGPTHDRQGWRIMTLVRINEDNTPEVEESFVPAMFKPNTGKN